jgi:hypothetical protein
LASDQELSAWAVKHGGEIKNVVWRLKHFMQCVASPLSWTQLWFSYMGRMMVHPEYRKIATDNGLVILNSFEEQHKVGRQGFDFSHYCAFCLRRGIKDMSDMGPAYLFFVILLVSMGSFVFFLKIPLIVILIFNWIFCLFLPLTLWIMTHGALHDALEEGEMLRTKHANGEEGLPPESHPRGCLESMLPRRTLALQYMRLAILVACYGMARTIMNEHFWREQPLEVLLVFGFAVLFMGLTSYFYGQVLVLLLLVFGAPQYCKLGDFKQYCGDMVKEYDKEERRKAGHDLSPVNMLTPSGQVGSVQRRRETKHGKESYLSDDSDPEIFSLPDTPRDGSSTARASPREPIRRGPHDCQ